MNNLSPPISRLQILAAKLREEREKYVTETTSTESTAKSISGNGNQHSALVLQNNAKEHSGNTDRFGHQITYNDKQNLAVETIAAGKSCVVIGAAGTGKTTSMKGATSALIQTGKVGVMKPDGHKHLLPGSPGIVVCAYTRRATANIRKNLPLDLQQCCVTIHKLLEYAPIYYDVEDPETGETKKKMVFEPTRHGGRPLPETIKAIFFEESSMIGTQLFQQVMAACPHCPQIIFLGDIQQLPPVFGPAILGFKMLELPVIELTEVYRQALESPIISLAHRVLSGRAIPRSEFVAQWKKEGQLTIRPWSKKIEWELAMQTIGAVFKKAYDEGGYIPGEDMILMPFNKSFGTIELNNIIANHIARKNKIETFEIVAGFNKIYLSPGDRVMYEKEDAIITKIEKNPVYTGKQPQPHSTTLDYWGYDPVLHTDSQEGTITDDSVDLLLSQAAGDDSDRVKKASHIVHIKMLAQAKEDEDEETKEDIKLDKASELNALILGYALTVHKSQGSEWRKVYFISHQSNATMLSRELIYTAVTRAKEELVVICEPEMFTNGLKSQRVKGNSWQEKAEYFKGKIDEGYIVN